MSIINKTEIYINFLEVINKALDVESLYEESLQIIYKSFKPHRIQIWEKIYNLNEMSISHEYFEGKEASMLKLRVPALQEVSLKTIESTKTWEYLNIKDERLTKYNINSLTAIDFTFPSQNKGALALIFKEEQKKLTTEDLKFLINFKKQLEDGLFKVEKYQKSQEEVLRLQNQNSKLREQDRLRTNFISNLAHEFRTPLSSILGFSKILTSKHPSSETTKEIVEQIQHAASRLSNLVADFLQINKIDTEGWLAHLEPCDIGELIKKSIDEFSSLYKEYKISYHVIDNYPIIKTDPKLVRQVLDNLISNAIKYSPNKGSIIASLQTTSNEKEIRISVIDHGIGIEKEEISKIFNRFYRASNPSVQKVSGTGLGLAICKEIINTLNGTIEVESELNKGSKFSFTLPIN